MKPVYQTIFHNSDKEIGDCFRACLASILELSVEEVPHFYGIERETKQCWLYLLQDWLKDREMFYIEILVNGSLWQHIFDKFYQGHYIVHGKSPRYENIKHSVVGFKGEVVHDPHPSHLGIDGKPDRYGILLNNKLATPKTLVFS